MTNKHRERKRVIRQFMREHYSDERLCALLAHARDGKLAYGSCCCFVGAANADHPLQGSNYLQISADSHYHRTPLNWAGTALRYFELVSASNGP